MCNVTILILIDGFLQFEWNEWKHTIKRCHNPYFNRWFSAIKKTLTLLVIQTSHNPYFNRWFSAIRKKLLFRQVFDCHNPYFNRWFSAIGIA